MNIRMTYLYRDSGNYKHWYEVVFPNPAGASVEQLTKDIKQRLISGEYFDQSQAPVTFDFPDSFDPDMDHAWLEFYSFEEVDETPHLTVDVEQFIQRL